MSMPLLLPEARISLAGLKPVALPEIGKSVVAPLCVTRRVVLNAAFADALDRTETTQLCAASSVAPVQVLAP